MKPGPTSVILDSKLNRASQEFRPHATRRPTSTAYAETPRSNALSSISRSRAPPPTPRTLHRYHFRKRLQHPHDIIPPPRSRHAPAPRRSSLHYHGYRPENSQSMIPTNSPSLSIKLNGQRSTVRKHGRRPFLVVH